MKVVQKTPSNQELRGLASRLARASGTRQVYLFGSYARNEEDLESDIDLGFVFPDATDGRRALLAAHRELWPREFSFDLVPLRQGDLDDRRTPLAREIMSRGILLYNGE